MKNILLPILSLFLMQPAANAQQQNELKSACHLSKAISLPNTARTTVIDPQEDYYDVHYVFLNLNLTNQSSIISGVATTKAKVIAPSMPQYVFELDTTMTVDSVKFNNQLLSVTSNGLLRKANLPAALPFGSNFSVQVFYHGVATRGIFNSSNCTYTHSEPYNSNGWWPCKQSLQDKIDSSDVWLIVPNGLKTGSNGLLKAIVPAGNGLSCHQWKSRYPIDYYLISAAVGSYNEYSYYMHFNNSTDSMLIQNLYPTNLSLPDVKPKLDSMALLINYYSSLFGRYPFWKEKYGHSFVPNMGSTAAMENQTMTTTVSWYMPTLAHELCHQWFGDNVTCATWGDVWLNEGFATYGASLYREAFEGDSVWRGMHYSNGLNTWLNGPVYCMDTANVFTTNVPLYYDKAGNVIHSLQFVVNDDSLFFQALRNYQQQYKGKTATTEQFKAVMSQTVHKNLDQFFDQWIYGAGHPIYNIKFNQIGDDVFVQLDQTASNPTSVPVFKTPLEIKLRSNTGDTIVRVNSLVSSEIFHFKWNKTVQTVDLDPNNWIMLELSNIQKDQTLFVSDLNTSSPNIFPNPTTDVWRISGIKENSQLVLTNITGQNVWSKDAGSQQEMNIPASGLPAGVYMLRITTPEKEMQVVKLVKQ